MGAIDPERYAAFKQHVCEIIRDTFDERVDWLSRLDPIIQSLRDPGMAEEIGAAISSYGGLFVEEVRQGLVDPFVPGSEVAHPIEAPGRLAQRSLFESEDRLWQ